MLKATELLNKFFEILILPELSKPDRIKSQWSYLLSLLKSENVQLERIEAYLNIIEKTQAKKRIDDGRQTPSSTISLHKQHRNSSNSQKEKDFAGFNQSTCSKDPQKTSQDETSVAAIAAQLLASIAPLNKLFQTNNKLMCDELHLRTKGEDVLGRGQELTPKMIRNNFRKQPMYDKGVVETKRYSSSFKNRY